METTSHQKAAQSAEDKKVIGIKQHENGYTFRCEGKVWVFATLDEVIQKLRSHYAIKNNP